MKRWYVAEWVNRNAAFKTGIIYTRISMKTIYILCEHLIPVQKKIYWFFYNPKRTQQQRNTTNKFGTKIDHMTIWRLAWLGSLIPTGSYKIRNFFELVLCLKTYGKLEVDTVRMNPSDNSDRIGSDRIFPILFRFRSDRMWMKQWQILAQLLTNG